MNERETGVNVFVDQLPVFDHAGLLQVFDDVDAGQILQFFIVLVVDAFLPVVIPQPSSGCDRPSD